MICLNKGTEGLNDIIEVRGYSEDEFLTAIKSYPEFWKSIKTNTLNTNAYQKEITEDISKLKNAYPDLKPAKRQIGESLNPEFNFNSPYHPNSSDATVGAD